ncbi:recombinase family protein [Ornithinimicrobium sp. Arc0846-15]|nr:recombinase family protein [Ornithinimicrobium laminariae]
MAEYGYARVSTADQSVALQVDALVQAGVPLENVARESASGTSTTRPMLNELLGRLEPGDRLTVWRFDRLFRSTRHLLEVTDDLRSRGVEFRSLRDNIDTTTASGRFFFTVTAALAEMEADLTRERTKAGLAAAKASGKQLGRPTKITPAQADMIHRLIKEGRSQRQAAAATGVSASAVGRLVRCEVVPRP